MTGASIVILKAFHLPSSLSYVDFCFFIFFVSSLFVHIKKNTKNKKKKSIKNQLKIN